MRVLVISHLYPSAVSHSSGSFVMSQVQRLRTHAEVQVASPVPWWPVPLGGRWGRLARLPRADQAGGMAVDRPRYLGLPRRWLFGRAGGSMARAVGLAVTRRPDVVHGHCAYHDGHAAVSLARRWGVPAVVTVHGYDLHDLAVAGSRWRPLVVAALAAADRVIGVSRELCRRVADLGIDAARITHVPNGVDMELFQPATVARDPASPWRLVYVGRLEPAKGIDELLQSVRWLRDQGRQVRAELVGGGEPARARAYATRARQLGIDGQVAFVGEVPQSQVAVHLAAADLLVLPSHSEGMPLSVIEALACGLPVVATACGGLPEIVDEMVGRLVAPGDAVALGQAIAAVLEGYGRYDRAAIRARTVERYDWRRVAERLIEVYRDVVAARSGA
ncbi:MAG: glycosyltransferase [Gemmatimonadota bacterium]